MNSNVLDLIYPKQCPLCGKLRPTGGSKACQDCVKGLKWISSPKCMKCGKQISDKEAEYCQDCVEIPKHYECGFPAVVYDGAIKDALYAFKYKNQRAYADFFVDMLLHANEMSLKQLKLDGIVPVPVHKSKRRSRGYNQAELLAKELSKRLDCPMYSDYLVRERWTNPQKELNDKSRMKNLKNAFKIGKNTIKLKKVLLVDDIYTSGATIESCTQCLLEAGVDKVYYTSVAIGQGFV